jgi:hypothetical protein
MTRSLSFGVTALAVVLIAVNVAEAQVADPPPVPARLPGVALEGPVPATATGVPNYFYYGKKLVAGEPQAADPETAKLMKSDHALSEQILALASRLKEVTDRDDLEEAEKKLLDLVTNQFEVRQSLRERQLAQLEAQLKRLRAVHEQREDQKDRIIEDRVEQLVREAQGLGWGELSEDFIKAKPKRVVAITAPGSLTWTTEEAATALPKR